MFWKAVSGLIKILEKTILPYIVFSICSNQQYTTSGFSAIFEALNHDLNIQECKFFFAHLFGYIILKSIIYRSGLTFGDTSKNIFSGPSPILHTTKSFVPSPVDTSSITLPHFAVDIHARFSENLHELWAKRKIDLGWTFGEVILLDKNQMIL